MCQTYATQASVPIKVTNRLEKWEKRAEDGIFISEIDFNSQSGFGFTASELLQQAQQQPCEPSTSSNTSPNNVNRTRIPVDSLSRNVRSLNDLFTPTY